MIRGVHGSGLCPTREPTRKRSGSIFSTRNRPVKGSGFAGRFSGGCHQFRVRPKPDGKHRKMAKIGDISPDPAKIRWGFRQIRLFFLQIVSRISGFGVSMPDLIILVAEICQIKLKTRRNQWKIRQNWCLRAGRVSRVFNEGTRNRPAGIGFWKSGPVADPWSSRIGWTPVGYGRVGRVGGWVGQPYSLESILPNTPILLFNVVHIIPSYCVFKGPKNDIIIFVFFSFLNF